MANETTGEAGNTLQKVLAQGKQVERAAVAPDGTVTIPHNEAILQTVDIADVDLLLGFSDGTYTVIPNGALDAISETPHKVIFNDNLDSLSSLFKMVGISNPAKAGSLRLVSEHIDAAKPPSENLSSPQEEPMLELPVPPAPMVKVSAGMSLGSKGFGKGPGLGGSGYGEGEGEVPATVTPLQTPQPTVYRIGQKSQIPITDLLSAEGMPNITTALYTSSEYKVTPSGRTDLPQGAYDSSASTSQLAERASNAKQATIETINGTSGNDTIVFNPAFSSDEGQWSKSLHIGINNFSDVTSIQLVFDAAKIAQIPGFDIKGLDGAVVTRDSANSNSWHVTPAAGMLLNGVNVAVVYDVSDSAVAIDFGADVIVNGHAGVFTFELTNNLNLTWRDAVTTEDYDAAKTTTGTPLLVLPSAGTGIEVNAGDGDDTVNSGAGPDLIHGGSGNDIINAGTGNDMLDGGTGADILNGGAGLDNATYAFSNGAVTASLTTPADNLGDASGDTFSSIENLTGSDFNDTLVGDSNSNKLNGGAGNDTLEGMGGADSLMGSTGTNTASYEHASTGVLASLGTAATNTNDAAGDTYTDIQNLTGSAYNDTLIGDIASNALSGGGGSDTLEGMGGADTLIGGSGNNTASYEHSVNGLTVSLDTPGINTGDAAGDVYTQIQNLTGSAYNDTLIGDNGNNALNGGSGNDLLEGMDGADDLSGGDGVDIASYEHASTFVTASLTTGLGGFANTGDATGDTYSNIENLTGSDYNDTLIGNSGNNTLVGGLGDDVLEGLGGSTDVLIGGDGSNTASYAHAATGVTASLDTPEINTGDATGDTYTQIQNLTGSALVDNLIGDSDSNTLNGGSGNDVLEGMGGADLLNGDAGNDTASYDRAISSVSASLTTGLAGFISTGDAAGDTYNSIENVTGSNYNDTLIGNSGNNTINGGGGADVLEGMAGADNLIGGSGNNTASYEHSIDHGAGLGITASLTTPSSNTGEAAGDTYTQIQNLSGSDFNDTLAGDIGNNILSGGTGDDTLQGMFGADTLVGDIGTDTATYVDSASAVTASLTTDFTAGATVLLSGDAFGDTYDSIENLTGSVYADTLIGSSTVNTISGGIGDDILEGMSGADILDGGIGSNTATYAHSTTAVLASLTAPNSNSGNDAIGDSYVNISNLTGSDFNDTLIGDTTVNTLTGGLGNDTLEGGSGADILNGSGGTDTASYAHSGEAILASLSNSGNNTGTDALGDTYISIENLAGSDFNDTLIGNAFANTLSGGLGNDLLEGLAGADVLDGGAGNNTASYEHSPLILGAGGALLGVTASLSSPGGNTGDAQGDSYTNIQNILGSDFNDTLTGDNNVNILTGGNGNDILEGLGGSDILSGGTGTDTVAYTFAGTAVTASLADATTNSGTDAAGDSYISIENLTGGDFSDSLVGDSGSNTLTGGSGDDALEGMTGADILVGGTGSNTVSFAHAGLAGYAGGTATTTIGSGVSASLTTSFLQGDAFSQTGDAAGDTYSGIANMSGSDYNDTLIGDSASNIISGGAGDDILEGLGGADSLDGGAGINTASYNHAAAQAGGIGVLASLDISYGINTGEAAGDTYANIQNLTGSTYNDTLIGNASANTLSGGLGDDILEGQAGADILDGGAGNNTASYAHASAIGGTIVSLANPGTNSGDAAGDTFLQIQNLTGSNFDDTLTGDTVSNILNGGAGNDLLDGGAGLTGDTLIGGSETDTATYANATGGILASLSGAFTADQTGDATADTFNGIENLTGSAFDDTLIGDSGTNTLTGGTGNDILEGMAGADVLVGGLIGGPDTDTASYTHASSSVVASLSLAGSLTSGPAVSISGDAVGDTYVSVENLLGSNFSDTLIGDANSNTLTGGLGNDILEGLGGADALDGGADTDTASYIHATGAVVASLATSFAAGPAVTTQGDAVGDTYNNIENLQGSTFSDTLIGNGNANSLYGDTGDDILEGLDGADLLDGGTGTDTVSYAHATGAVVASLSTVFAVGPAVTQLGDANGDTYVSIENMAGSDFNDTLIGNSSANVLSGGAGDDILEGIGGGDTYDGGTGNNTVSYAHATDTGLGTGVTASLLTPLDPTGNLGAAAGDLYTNIQNLTGSDFNDTLAGDANNNILIGGLGDDTLTGGAGTDTVYGGLGNDSILDDGAGAARLYGEDGDDTFHISSADTNVDIIDGGDKSALRLSGTWSGAGDTISWEATTFNRIDVDMTTHLIRTYSPVNGSYISFANIENFTVTGNNTIYATLDNYSNTIDATSNGTANSDFVLYQNALGSIDLHLTWDGVTPNVTGGSSVLDNLNQITGTDGIVRATWSGTGDTLKGIEHVDSGSYYADNIYGNGVNNRLAGSLGADYIDGGNGTDTVYLDPGRNQAVVASLMTATQNTAMGITMTDTAQGDTYVNIEGLYSSGASDQLYGNSGSNILTSNGIMEGFAGADNLVSQNSTNATASYANAGNIYLAAEFITTTAATGVTANLTSPGGTAFANAFSGVAADSGLGAIVVNTGDAAGDTYSNNMYRLTGSAYRDILIGNGLNNTITGNDGDDIMEGLAGADSFIGGNGIDTVSYAHAASGVIMDLGTSGLYVNIGAAGVASDAVTVAAGLVTAVDTYTGVENVIGSIYNDTLAGNSLANMINGGAGNDFMDGSANTNGFDIASYAYATGAANVSLALQGAAQNTVNAGLDTLINFEGLLGSNHTDTLTGDNNNNWIDGGLEADTLDGGAGDDTLAYTSATVGVTVALNGTNSQSDILSNFENLLGSIYGDVLTGDALSNAIEGDLGNDTLDGGANTASGDTVSYSLATAGVTVNLANTGQQNTVAAGLDTISNFENLTGSDYGDYLTGDAGANIITGGLGNDLLTASGGGDTLSGGAGTDTVSYFGSGAVTVTINSSATHDGFTDILTGMENLIGSSFADIITGDSGDNFIDGGLGNDTVIGGAGIDTISYANAGAAVNVDLSGAGVNVSGAYGSDTLTLMENIIGSIANDSLTGDGNANIIEGGAGNDVLAGGAGIDTASYSTADNGVFVNLAIATAQNTSGAGSDTLSQFENLIGSAHNDTLTGDSAANSLNGGAGDDLLIGGVGADALIGGIGTDTVSYASAGSNIIMTLGRSGQPAATGDAVGDTFNSIENVIGSNNNDNLSGSAGNNTITGGLGDDLIYASDGNDIIYANQGHDSAYGENSNDTFYVSSLVQNLPNLIDGGSGNGSRDAGNVQNHGGNVMVLQDLVSGSYDITLLAGLNSRIVNIDTLNIRDGASTTMTMSSQDIRNMVDSGNTSQLFVEANTGDTLNLSLAAGESMAISQTISSANGSVYTDYTVFNAANAQVAQIHWHTS